LVLLRVGFIPHKEQTSKQYENCALLSYYAASSGNYLTGIPEKLILPIFEGQESFGILELWDGTDRLFWNISKVITTTCCVAAQKGEVLIYFAAEAWNHALRNKTFNRPVSDIW